MFSLIALLFGWLKSLITADQTEEEDILFLVHPITVMEEI